MSTIFELYMEESYPLFTMNSLLESVINENDAFLSNINTYLVEGIDFKSKFKEIIAKILKAISTFKKFVLRIIGNIKKFISSKKTEKAMEVIKVEKLDKKTLKDIVNRKLSESTIINEESSDYQNRTLTAAMFALQHSEQILLSEVIDDFDMEKIFVWEALDYMEAYRKSIFDRLGADKDAANERTRSYKASGATSIEYTATDIKEKYENFVEELESKLSAKAKNIDNLTFEAVLRCCSKGPKRTEELANKAKKTSERIEVAIQEMNKIMTSGKVSRLFDDVEISTDDYKDIGRMLAAYNQIQAILTNYIVRLEKCASAQEAFADSIIKIHVVKDKDQDQINAYKNL